jgi:hypothetical protein
MTRDTATDGPGSATADAQSPIGEPDSLSPDTPRIPRAEAPVDTQVATVEPLPPMAELPPEKEASFALPSNPAREGAALPSLTDSDAKSFFAAVGAHPTAEMATPAPAAERPDNSHLMPIAMVAVGATVLVMIVLTGMVWLM